MSIEVLTCSSQLIALRDAWNRLATHPMSRFEWLYAWHQTFGAGKRLHTVVVRDFSGSVIGIAPWYEDLRWGVITLRFMGSGKVCSDYAQILADPNHLSVVASELHHHLGAVSREHSGWLFRGVDLEGIARSQFQVSGLWSMLTHDGYRIRHLSQQNCWQLHLPDSWDAMLERLGSSFRRKIRKLMERVDAGEYQVRTIQTSEAWLEGREVLRDLHQARRASLGEEGCFSFRSFMPFLDAAIPAMLDEGQAELCILTHEGQSIAVVLLLKAREYIGVYQTGICPNATHLQPGHVLNGVLIRRAIGNAKIYDLLRGDEGYKASWRAIPIPIERVSIIPASRLSRCSMRCEDTVRDLARYCRHQYARLRSCRERWMRSPQTTNGTMAFRSIESPMPRKDHP